MMLGVVKQVVRTPTGGMPPYVVVKPQETDIEVRPVYYDTPPPLLSYVWVDGYTGGEYVAGVLTDVREVMFDDFCQVSNNSAPASGGPFTGTQQCDTNWRYVFSSGSVIADPGGQAGAGVNGVVDLKTSAAAANRFVSLRKSDQTYSYLTPTGWSMSGKLNLIAPITTMNAHIGFTPDSNAHLVRLLYDTNTGFATWILQAFDGATSASMDTGVAASAGYMEFDLTFVPGEYAYVSMNGDAGLFVASGVPTRAQAAAPRIEVQTYAASLRWLRADYMRVSALYGDVSHPVSDPILTGGTVM